MPPAGYGTGSASGSRSGRCHDSSSADESIAGGDTVLRILRDLDADEVTDGESDR